MNLRVTRLAADARALFPALALGCKLRREPTRMARRAAHPGFLAILLAVLAICSYQSALASGGGPVPTAPASKAPAVSDPQPANHSQDDQTREQTRAQIPHVLVLHLDDTIQPISEQYLERGLAQAADQHADALLVELDTPGGLLSSTRTMVHAILASPTPVIVYVTPSGSRAGSAGFFLLEASDIAAMAPGTNAGAAHPVVETGKLDPIMKQKLENDTTAFLRSYVSVRKRNVDAAQDAVLNSKSYTADEALKLNLITLIAPDAATLLNTLDGRSITRFSGATLQLHTRDALLIAIEPTIRERLLEWLIDPNIALLCLVLGALLIYLEFNVPGTIIPGAIGTLLLVTSLFALNLLPVRLTAVMLLIAALALLLLEVKAPSHGVLAVAGIVCLVFGSLTLVAGPIPEQRIHIATAAGAGVGFGLITTFLIRIAWRARRNKVLTGPQAMLGAIAVAQEPFRLQGGPVPRGQVLVRGELWFAELASTADQAESPADFAHSPLAASPAPVADHLAPGDRARVTAIRGLTLLVERIP